MPSPISLSDFRALLQRHGFHPSKARGQNFLHDPNLSDAIASLAKIETGEHVLEVGTGCGYLTAAIAKRAKKVLTVEIDERLHQIAQEVLKDDSNIEFVVGDFLDGKAINPEVKKKLDTFAPFILVANLPYSVGGTILASLATFSPPPPRMIAMLQKEVAERCMAKPGSRDRGPLSLLLQLYYEIEIVKQVPPGVFWPKPEVSSAVLRMTRYREALSKSEEENFRKVVTTLFEQKRKQVGKVLQQFFGGRTGEILEKLSINPQFRPENLATEDFLRLSQHI